MADSLRPSQKHRLVSTLFSILATTTVALLLALPALVWGGCSRDTGTDTKQGASDGAIIKPANNSDNIDPATNAERVKRGEYMVTIGGCNDCHTPWVMGPKGPEPDMTRMLSGHPETEVFEGEPTVTPGWDGMTAARTLTAFSGAWGTSYAMNLTPDSLTGIGTWTEEMFIKTIRSGKHWGTSRPIMPPMPWFNYAKMTDEDLKSVYAYLRTIPPVVNNIQPYRPPMEKVAAK